jgi:hypothetical protein
MRFGWLEETLRNGEVVATYAERILGDDASQLVLLDPLQGGVAILEHTGRKPCLLAVEDPDLWQVDIDFGIVFMHGTDVYQPTGRSLDQACSFAADNARQPARSITFGGRPAVRLRTRGPPVLARAAPRTVARTRPMWTSCSSSNIGSVPSCPVWPKVASVKPRLRVILRGSESFCESLAHRGLRLRPDPPPLVILLSRY